MIIKEPTKPFVLRVDIDTVSCVKSLPSLLTLADALNIKLTIFATLGRTISRKQLFSRLAQRETELKTRTRSHKLSAFQKLGFMGFIETTFINPDIFSRLVPILKSAQRSGHEVGLHGGLNHGLWQHLAPQMDNHEIEAILLPAIERFESNFGPLHSFTSPGFSINPFAYSLLEQTDCRYVSDSIDPYGVPRRASKARLFDLPVTLCGENRVDFLEQQYARCEDPLNDSRPKTSSDRPYEMYYTHPCFAANQGRQYFVKLIKDLSRNGKTTTGLDLANTFPVTSSSA